MHTVQPALKKFYGCLGDEQKEQFKGLALPGMILSSAGKCGGRPGVGRPPEHRRCGGLFGRDAHLGGSRAHFGIDVFFVLDEVLLEHATSLRAVLSNSALSLQVFIG